MSRVHTAYVLEGALAAGLVADSIELVRFAERVVRCPDASSLFEALQAPVPPEPTVIFMTMSAYYQTEPEFFTELGSCPMSPPVVMLTPRIESEEMSRMLCQPAVLKVLHLPLTPAYLIALGYQLSLQARRQSNRNFRPEAVAPAPRPAQKLL